MLQAHAAAAFLAALAITLAFGGPAIRAIRRMGLRSDVREDTPERHQAKAGTPSMGGLFLMPAAIVAMVALAPGVESAGVALFAAAYGALGFTDDYTKARAGRGRGLKARTKLAAQALLGIGMVAYTTQLIGRRGEIELPWSDKPVALGGWLYVLGIGVSIAVSNALNLTDGLDGLAAGSLVPVMVACVGAFALQDRTAYAVIAAALCGACVGFLPFNVHPARIWMGDTGSMALGGAVAALAVFSGMEWFVTVAGLVFLAEMVSVMLQVASFQTTGRRIFRMSPLHHHFELGGARETVVVRGFWIASALCSLVALALMYRVP